MEAVIVFTWSFRVFRDWFSGLRGGKFNLPIFCIVAVASSWLSTGALSLSLGEGSGPATGPSCGECFSNRSVGPVVGVPSVAVGIAAPALPSSVVFVMSAI